MAVEKDGYIFRKSTRKNKKYDVLRKNGEYITSFGDNRYKHFRDKIGLYFLMNHLDEERRERYYQRHGKDAKFESAKWFSHKYLW